MLDGGVRRAFDGGAVLGDAGAAQVAEAVGLLRRALDDAVAASSDARLAHAVGWEATAADRFRESLGAMLAGLRGDVAELAVAATGTPW